MFPRSTLSPAAAAAALSESRSHIDRHALTQGAQHARTHSIDDDDDDDENDDANNAAD